MSLRSCKFTHQLRLCILQTMHQLVHFWISRITSYAIFPNREIKKQKYCPQLTIQYYCYDRTFYHFPQCKACIKVCLLELKKLYVHLQSKNVKN